MTTQIIGLTYSQRVIANENAAAVFMKIANAAKDIVSPDAVTSLGECQSTLLFRAEVDESKVEEWKKALEPALATIDQSQLFGVKTAIIPAAKDMLENCKLAQKEDSVTCTKGGTCAVRNALGLNAKQSYLDLYHG